ncbi:MAG: hypothetical protein QOH52_903, partial [Pseudonocardiales bacterium]|nr:hypothetical protein [Pseudonocardiales bacterium]
MSRPSEGDAASAAINEGSLVANRLGPAVAQRMRRPGPPLGRLRPARPGSVASSVQRFAAATSRPIRVRRALEGPAALSVHPTSGPIAPPRWWTPTRAAERDSLPPVAVAELPARGLPRAVRRVPNEQTWTPGGIAVGMKADVVQVPRRAEVTAAGPMLMQQDRARLTPPRAADRRASTVAGNVESSGSADPPAGPPPGGGSGPSTPPTGATAVSGAANAQPAAVPPGATFGSTRPAPVGSRFLAAVRRTPAPAPAARHQRSTTQPPTAAVRRRGSMGPPAAVSTTPPAAVSTTPAASVAAPAAASAAVAAAADDKPRHAVDRATAPPTGPAAEGGASPASAAAPNPAAPPAAGASPDRASAEPLPVSAVTKPDPSASGTDNPPVPGTVQRSTSGPTAEPAASPAGSADVAPTLGTSLRRITAAPVIHGPEFGGFRAPGTSMTPRVAPLRRMIGATHPLRPAARAADAVPRPAAVPMAARAAT